MSLTEQINTDLKDAMRAKDKEKLEAIRAIKSALLLEKTSGASHEITPETELKILQKLVKQRRDSAQLYQEQNRQDLADKELSEAGIIETYLPKQLDDAELKAFIEKLIAQTGAQSMKDMGKVMGMANKQLAGKADGKRIANQVKQLLS